ELRHLALGGGAQGGRLPLGRGTLQGDLLVDGGEPLDGLPLGTGDQFVSLPGSAGPDGSGVPLSRAAQFDRFSARLLLEPFRVPRSSLPYLAGLTVGLRTQSLGFLVGGGAGIRRIDLRLRPDSVPLRPRLPRELIDLLAGSLQQPLNAIGSRALQLPDPAA